jgi:hypothetical protein
MRANRISTTTTTLTLLFSGLGSCGSPTEICQDDAGCAGLGAGARCEEPVGRCSLPDAACPTGHRFDEGAGYRAKKCVPPDELGPDDGGGDTGTETTTAGSETGDPGSTSGSGTGSSSSSSSTSGGETSGADTGTADASSADDGTAGGGMLETVEIEAESMMLTGYEVDTVNAGYIRIPDAGTTGTATAMFSGPGGDYQVRVVIGAEEDGQPQLSLSVDGTAVFDETYPLADMGTGVMSRELGPFPVTLSDGAMLQLDGTAAAMTSFARVDKLIFEDPTP